MKVKGGIALASLTIIACLISGTSSMISAEASTTESRVTRLGYESIFDGWREVSLNTMTIHGTGTMPEIDPDSRQLYETVAQDLGQPVEEFIAATWSGNAFNELVDELTLTYPNLFVGASRANPAVTTSRYDLVFTKFPPSDVVDQVSALPVDVDIRTGAPLSYEQLMKVREALTRGYSSDSRLVVDFSPLATSIRVRYLPRSGVGAGAAKGDQLRSAAGDLVSRLMPQGASRPAIKVELDDSLGSEVDFADYMAGFGYSNTNCTTGFAATLNGVRGLLTARHCSDYLIYAPTGDNLGPSYNAVSGVDIQWNAAPSAQQSQVVRRFRIDWMGTTRSVTGVADPVGGDYIEKFGMVTGWTWGYVTNANTCGSSGYCNVFRVNMNGDVGDSGGPCVTGQAARGVVQSGVTGSYTNCTKISYSPATVMQW